MSLINTLYSSLFVYSVMNQSVNNNLPFQRGPGPVTSWTPCWLPSNCSLSLISTTTMHPILLYIMYIIHIHFISFRAVCYCSLKQMRSDKLISELSTYQQKDFVTLRHSKTTVSPFFQSATFFFSQDGHNNLIIVNPFKPTPDPNLNLLVFFIKNIRLL